MKREMNADVSNIYQLEGQVPVMKAIPFGLQHILAMFVSNLTPITIIAAAGGLRLHMTQVAGELVTPTGAAIAAAVKTKDQLPASCQIEAVSLGAGSVSMRQPASCGYFCWMIKNSWSRR